MTDKRIDAAQAMMRICLQEPERHIAEGNYDWTGNDVWGCDFLEMADAALAVATDIENQEIDVSEPLRVLNLLCVALIESGYGKTSDKSLPGEFEVAIALLERHGRWE